MVVYLIYMFIGNLCGIYQKKIFFQNFIWKRRLQIGGHFGQISMC